MDNFYIKKVNFYLAWHFLLYFYVQKYVFIKHKKVNLSFKQGRHSERQGQLSSETSQLKYQQGGKTKIGY